LNRSESWRAAGVVAQEVRFQSFLEANPANLSRVKENPEKISKAIKSQSRMNIFFSSMILILLAVLALAASAFDTDLGNPEATLAVGFAVYLTLSFVVIFFLNLTTTTGLFTSGAMNLPSSLPLTRVELEQLNFMTFVRIFIAPVILSMTIFPIGCLLIYGPIVAFVALVACASTVSIAIGALIRVSKWFHKKTHQTDESRLSSVIRVAASLGIVIGMISIYSIGSYLPDLIRFIIALSSSAGEGFFTILALIFPFSFGFLAAAIIFSTSIELLTLLASIAGTLFYAAIALVSFKRSGESLREITLGGISTSSPGLLKEVEIEVATPLRGMIKKDIQLATRNIGSAFIFAIPIFLVVMLFPMIQYWGEGPMRSYPALVALEYANLFGGISLVSVLMFDTQGASIHEGLPVSSRLILRSKTAIMIIPYTLSMIALDIVFWLNSPISFWILLMPVIQIPCGYVLGMTVGAAVFKMRGGGRAVAVNVTNDQVMGFVAGAIAAGVGIAPLVAYGLTMILSGSHIISLTAQGFVIILLVLLARFQVPKLLKD
jgi:hypothetical protein